MLKRSSYTGSSGEKLDKSRGCFEIISAKVQGPKEALNWFRIYVVVIFASSSSRCRLACCNMLLLEKRIRHSFPLPNSRFDFSCIQPWTRFPSVVMGNRRCDTIFTAALTKISFVDKGRGPGITKGNFCVVCVRPFDIWVGKRRVLPS